MSELAAHLTLLGSAFLAATIIPGSSELVLIGMVLDRPDAVVTLFLTATIGNTAGSAVNYVLGRWFLRYATRRWFPASQKQLDRAGAWFNRYGAWSLLLAWLPFVGDALTLIAGAVRMNVYAFVGLVGIGKAVRYAAVLWGTEMLRAVL
jgi:membrane protein YqaA with SNARE-associated domain